MQNERFPAISLGLWAAAAIYLIVAAALAAFTKIGVSAAAMPQDTRGRSGIAVFATSALWGAVAVPLITSAVLELVVYPTASLDHFRWMFPRVFAFGAPPGLLLATLGGIGLRFFAPPRRTMSHLFVQAVIAGIALSIPASLLAVLVGMFRGNIAFLLLIDALMGGISGFGYAAVFHSLLLMKRSKC